jgi:uncharacterized damage-inducible protein DinB
MGITFNSLLSQRFWTEADRKLLLDGLMKTKADLLSEIKDLDEYQMAFKPDSTSWSIAEVIEHLALYEEHLYWDLLYQQYTPERQDLVAQVSGNDEKLLSYATDPGKGSAPWLAEPMGRFETKPRLVHYFTKFRDEVISLIKGTTSDLRLHFVYRQPSNSIWDVRDLHQYTLVWIAHTTRHINQIKRIRNTENFPELNKKFWTEEDRSFLLKELRRTKDKLSAETENLTMAQWHFKPSEKSWSIAQVVEHIGLYERIVMQEAWIANSLPPQPEFHHQSNVDSTYLAWMAETDPHVASENAIPLEFMKGKDNLVFFLYGRDLMIQYISETDNDLKTHFTPRESEPNNRRSIHGLFVVHFGHTDRHLRQIERIKSNPGYPKG